MPSLLDLFMGRTSDGKPLNNETGDTLSESREGASTGENKRDVPGVLILGDEVDGGIRCERVSSEDTYHIGHGVSGDTLQSLTRVNVKLICVLISDVGDPVRGLYNLIRSTKSLLTIRDKISRILVIALNANNISAQNVKYKSDILPCITSIASLFRKGEQQVIRGSDLDQTIKKFLNTAKIEGDVEMTKLEKIELPTDLDSFKTRLERSLVERRDNIRKPDIEELRSVSPRIKGRNRHINRGQVKEDEK